MSEFDTKSGRNKPGALIYQDEMDAQSGSQQDVEPFENLKINQDYKNRNSSESSAESGISINDTQGLNKKPVLSEQAFRSQNIGRAPAQNRRVGRSDKAARQDPNSKLTSEQPEPGDYSIQPPSPSEIRRFSLKTAVASVLLIISGVYGASQDTINPIGVAVASIILSIITVLALLVRRRVGEYNGAN